MPNFLTGIFHSSKKRLLIVCSLILALFFTTSLLLLSQKTTDTPKTSPDKSLPSQNQDEIKLQQVIFPPEQKIIKVGEETIYGKDLNDIVNTKYAVDIVSKIGIDEVKKRAIQDAEDESVLLQDGKKRGEVELTDISLRDKFLEELKSKRMEEEEKISGAFISIWYHNVRPPSIPVEDAQKLALTKITKIYNDLKAEKITFQEAGEQVRSDTSLAQIDKSYTGNAYFDFSEHSKTQKTFVYEALENILWQLDEGQISEIIQFPGPETLPGSAQEEFYGIIKVTKRANKGNGSFENWLKTEKQNYAISVY